MFLKTYDNVFASRPTIQATKYLAHGGKGILLAKSGPYLQNVKRLCASKLLSSSRIAAFAYMRKKEVENLVGYLKGVAENDGVVNVSEMVGEAVENMTYKMLIGRSKCDGLNLGGLAKEALEIVGAFNAADYLPFLGPFDLQGLARRMKSIRSSVDEVLDKIIEEHENNTKEDNEQEKDLLDIMLSLIKQTIEEDFIHDMDQTIIRAIVADLIVGAFDTSATVVEWVLSELLKSLRVMSRLQEELESVIGLSKMVQEVDLTNLTYLEMVIKESMRLHPLAPLLTPHESIEDVIVNGYHISEKTRVFVNLWAIVRDHEIWFDDAEEFVLERFENLGIEYNDFRFIPFGSSRRRCLGMHLGLVTVRLLVAQLVHCFDWELPDKMEPNELDMMEKFSLVMPRAQPLMAKPTYRLLC